DVDRHVARVAPRAQQVPRLDRAARPELDERPRAGEPADFRGVLGEERRLRARLVVLRLLADVLEDVAPRVVVEPTTVEPARVVGERADDRLCERVRRLLEQIDVELEAGVALAPEAGGGLRPRHLKGLLCGPASWVTPCGVRGT